MADGFEECEALIVVDILRRAGIETLMASIMGRKDVISSREIKIDADLLAEEVDFTNVDLIFLPGGRLGTENLGKHPVVQEKCRIFANAPDRMVAAICAAPSILANLGLLAGKHATCHPDFEKQMRNAVVTGESVTVAGNIITGQGLGAAFPLAFELVERICGVGVAEQIQREICYRG